VVCGHPTVAPLTIRIAAIKKGRLSDLFDSFYLAYQFAK
jgi:hypothetical protein